MFSRYAVIVVISLCGLSSLSQCRQSDDRLSGRQTGRCRIRRRRSAAGQLVGRPAPNITLRSIHGGTIDIVKNYGHKPVYLKVWATYCIPCRAQMPGFEKIYQRYGTKMQVVAVDARYW